MAQDLTEEMAEVTGREVALMIVGEQEAAGQWEAVGQWETVGQWEAVGQ